MQKLLVKSVLFLVLNACLAVLFLHLHEQSLSPEAWQTDSVLLSMPRKEHRDLVLLGTSHIYVLSRFKNHHTAVESILNRSVFNMALPHGGGITPARFNLETYWDEGNTTDHVVYGLDPFVLFSAGANDNHKFVHLEPFHLAYCAKMIRNGYPFRRILTYARSKFTMPWLDQHLQPLIQHDATVSEDEYTEARIAMRLESLYPEGLPEDVFQTYTAEFERIVALCEAHDTPLTVIVPPTLLGHEAGHDAMMTWLRTLEKEHHMTVYDWVNVMPDPTKYYNLDHMNLSGIQTFITEWLGPVLDSADTP